MAQGYLAIAEASDNHQHQKEAFACLLASFEMSKSTSPLVQPLLIPITAN